MYSTGAFGGALYGGWCTASPSAASAARWLSNVPYTVRTGGERSPGRGHGPGAKAMFVQAGPVMVPRGLPHAERNLLVRSASWAAAAEAENGPPRRPLERATCPRTRADRCRLTSPSPPVGGMRTRTSRQRPGWLRWLPGLQLLRHYPAAWWRHDMAAGLVLTTMLVPVGIAYAVASGVPGIHGLYATIAALLAYALFGPSRILVLGPDSSLAALILAVVLPLSAGDPARAVALAGAMAIAVGPDLHRRRAGEAGLRHRAAVQADPLRLHERHRAGGDRQPVAQAVRHLDRRATARRRRRVALRAARCGTAGQRRGPRPRRGVAGADPAAEALAARARHAHRHRRCHRRGDALRPGPARTA